MKGKEIACPKCGTVIEVHRNPVPTVDVIIEAETAAGGKGVVLILRKNEPRAWALPGGFVDYGETLEEAAAREGKEETGLDVEEMAQFHAYSDPRRDPRRHTISVVFTAQARGKPQGADDAERAEVFPPEKIPRPLAFDHEKILEDYFAKKNSEP